MKHTPGSFQTADGLNIHTESWLPDGDPSAVVLLVHGYAEHIGRYAHVAGRLVDNGFAVYGLDHRGHGQSEGLRAYFEDFDQPVNDLKQYFDSIKAAHANAKIFLYAHSMGSLIGLAFALRCQDQLAGLILTATAVDADKTIPPAIIALGKFLSTIIPRTPLLPALPSAALSRDAAVGAAYDADPLVYRGAYRVKMGVGILRSAQELRQRADALHLPLLILHGSADAITPLSGSERIYRQASSSDKTLRVFPDAYHEVHNELEKETLLDVVVNWLNARLA